MACECCTTAMTTAPTMRPLYRVYNVGGRMAKATELVTAQLCEDCREHGVGECPKCFVNGEEHIIVWQHAWLGHMAQFHPVTLNALAATPAPVKPRSTAKHLGRLFFPKRG